MDPPDELMHQIGAFEPFEAKKVLALLEAHGIPFEVEAESLCSGRSNAPLQFYFGVYPEGSKLAGVCPESKQDQVLEALKDLFHT